MINEQTNTRTTTVTYNRRQSVGFIAYARSRVDKIQAEGRYDAAHKLNAYISRFVAFLGKNDIPFKDFDALLMHNYRTWLENRKLGRNTISLYIRNLKRVYQLAVDDGLTKQRYPFKGVDVSYRIKKEKNGLTLDEIKRLHGLDLGSLHPSLSFARDIFLFSVFTHGMTGGDIFHLTKDNIRDGRLVYRPKSTGREVTLLWEPILQEIVDRHARPDTPYLFPVITSSDPHEQWKQHCATLHNINRNLKKIGRMLDIPFPLTMTVAHHSWESMTRGLTVGNLL